MFILMHLQYNRGDKNALHKAYSESFGEYRNRRLLSRKIVKFS